jgi:predicted esterase
MKPRRLAAIFFCITTCVGAQERPRAWTFEELLRPPTTAELRRVDEDWAGKRLVVSEISLINTTTVPVGSERFEARVYTYELNGSPRCGAVILPHAATPQSLAGLVDIGDISWDYRDRNLTNGPYVAKILGDRAREFALVVPCSRGMALRIGDVRVQAEGDRRDAWEGHAEDAIAFLTAALSVTPAIDSQRLGAYGYSRGGGVALIVGERDARVKAVLGFAGPTDWFTAMGRPGVNWAQRLEQAARDPALQPDTRENQFLDWFIRDRATLPLADLRRRLVGSSPLYFTDKLPPFQIHHGMDDGPVPVRNAIALRDRVAAQDQSRRVFIYEGAGHLLDDTAALTIARAFLVERLR